MKKWMSTRALALIMGVTAPVGAATGGTVGRGTGTVSVTTSQCQDDGAGRRGRYRFEGYAAVRVCDDGHEERLLSFPTQAGPRGVDVGGGSLMLDS